MSNETTENFLKVMATFKWPEPKPITYRLYYNDDGSPKCYTMEELPGKYIQIDREDYILHRWNVRVVNDKLTIVPIPVVVHKLQTTDTTGTCCDPRDICVIVHGDKPHLKWSVIQNETH